MRQRKHRILFFWIIFIITLIIIPILLLYSSGYRIDTNGFKIVKTGSLHVETIPKNADIYINDKLYPKTAPVLINNLAPNEYNIRINKNGYSTWEKKLKIESTKTVFLQDIILVKNNIQAKKISKKDFPLSSPKEIITTEIAKIIADLNLSSNLKIDNTNGPVLTILDKKNNFLYLIETDNLSVQVEEVSEQATDFSWNRSTLLSGQENKKLLFHNDLEIWIYNYATKEQKLITRQSEKITEAIWFNDNYIIYAEADKIKLLEIDERDYRHCSDLIEATNPANLILDKKQEILYFEADKNYWQIDLLD